MKKVNIIWSASLGVILASGVVAPVPSLAQSKTGFKTTFDSENVLTEKKGRGTCVVADGVLTTKDAYASFGNRSDSNYEIRFRARTPLSEEQVQIWAGFREKDRDDRYVLGFRGGLQDNIYLSRMGYMGTDEFLALRNLDFHPQPGTWYDFRILVAGNRIQVFLGKENRPRIDVTDKNSRLAPAGKIILGGGWLKTDYDDLRITALSADPFNSVSHDEYAVVTSEREKAARRERERAAWRPISVSRLLPGRTSVSLNGQWLFMPSYQMPDDRQAASPAANDKDWHSMQVPDFWNPIRIWLHGEMFGPHSKGASDAYFRKETERCENYTFDYKKTNVAWYRQWIELPSGIEDKATELVFDAVSKVAEVWINGVLAGKHTGMFGDFRVDGKGLFRAGKNLVAVKVVRDFVKNIQDAGKVVDVAVSVEVTNKMLKDLAHGFYGGDPAGIWQPVSLIITDPLLISDVFIKPSLSGAAFEVTVKNATGKDRPFTLATGIRSASAVPSAEGPADKDGQALYSGEALSGSLIRAGEERTFYYEIKGLHPRLWSPQSPHLYDFSFRLISEGQTTDSTSICSGFRTFESRNGFLYLNGNRYWLRGGNQTAFALAPNNRELADRFYDIMKEGNIEVTRTHTTPYNELWVTEADRKGVGISFEGTWPWLFLSTSMPDSGLIRLWADEWLAMLKKYRNHPSILLWTINNEMKFYDNDPDLPRARRKMTIISDVVKRMRAIDSTRPVVFDSNYKRKGKEKKFGKDFLSTIDDGDLDDIHSYPNWYDHSLFRQFNGEFQEENLTPGRPLISQEMSTGYPNAETGHPTRFYTLVHQTPQTLVGKLAYEYSDPAYFLESQAFISSELAEALRRTNEKASGVLHFALITWFRAVYDAQKIAPWPVYYAMKRALQPVLVSAELWGRNFYTGDKLPTRVCIVNDKEDGSDLPATTLGWKLVGPDGKPMVSGSLKVPPVKHYGREWVQPVIVIPASLPQGRTEARLVFELRVDGALLSTNEYKVILGSRDWVGTGRTGEKKLVLYAPDSITAVFDALHIPYIAAHSVKEALMQKADLYVFSGLQPARGPGSDDPQNGELQEIRGLMANGKKLLLLDAESYAPALFPEYIKGSFGDPEADIVNMDIPESPVFAGIGPLDLRYFNNNKRELPLVCHGTLKIDRMPNLDILARHMKVHGYLNGDMDRRARSMENIQGAAILQIRDKGMAILSTMALEKATTDPVAGKLLTNMITTLSEYKP
ncbi:MAG TPA: glycoside hydrolase family 2 TIM barrel-domain containing protein [Puia sp.]|nr:glycoside hydrolase family 2 TIM barrel-domain containing protein [Puia sp.]